MTKCIVCEKEFEGTGKSRYCSVKCRVKAHRQNKAGETQKTVIVESTKTIEEKVPQEPIISTVGQKGEYTVERWKAENPNPTFTPNWVVKGYKSREEAITDVLKKVRANTRIVSTGLEI